MKTWSMPAVPFLLTLLSCACVACGARHASDAPTVASANQDDSTKTEYRPPSLDAPAMARPVRSTSNITVNTTVAAAEGVQVERWAKVRRAERERRQADPEAHVQAEEANQARTSTLPPHERESLEALEAALVDELNRLRSNPVGYTSRLSEFRAMYRDGIVTVPGHMAVRTREGVVAVDDAIAVAQATPAMGRLVRSDGLTRSARAHAFQLGHERALQRGDEDGSITLLRRMDAYGRASGMFGENVGAVYRDARLMLLELFVDDGVEMRVHRYNMIGPMFRVVGVGCAPHPTYDVVCVMDFAESFIEASASR